MNQSIEIRDLTFEDIRDVTLILQEISNYYPQEGSEEAIWQVFSSQENIYPRVAIKDNQVVGCANLLIEKNIRGGTLGHIGDVAIRKNMQSMGLGRILIEDLKLIAKRHGCYKVVLSCDDASLDFYKKLGFLDIANSATLFLLSK